jgi:hypothetical protein
MSENPERKILKETLVALRTKVLLSQKRFHDHALLANQTMGQNIIGLLEQVEKLPEGEPKDSMRLVINLSAMWMQNFNMVLINADNLIEDLNLYNSTLERYSSELSNIFEEAEKKYKEQLEEQEKQQAELMKKQPSYRT